jgi:multiple antibiotic resistance protein
MDHAELAKAFGAFFAVMNPFVNLPIFLGLTTGFSVAQQRILAVKVFFFSAIMSAIVLLAGAAIIGFFGVTVNQFRIAGGAVLVKIAWSMLNGTGITSTMAAMRNSSRWRPAFPASHFIPLRFQ